MNWILKNKKKNSTALFVVLFLVFGFLFFVSSDVKAANTPAQQADLDRAAAQTAAGTNTFGSTTLSPGVNTTANGVNGNKQTATSTTAGTQVYQDKSSLNPLTGGMQKTQPTGDAPGSNPFEVAIRWILTQIQKLVGWLFAIAATLFAWAIEPSNMSGETGMLNKQAVRDVWTMVRDLLNMTFILVLLFAAFCTIFQVDKWNLKKVWLNILINALLVNFSYPIARFFIDVSNVAFYYFVNHLFSSTGAVTGSSIMAMFGSSSTIGNLLQPASFTADPIAYQIAMIVLIFIMGMTLLIVAGLFLIRLIALTMLVMFSPIGFVGYIFPDTAKHADGWWKKLFAYSFFAPVMIFGIAISLRIAEALKAENIKSMIANASTNAPADQIQWISDMAFYFIPVMILWMFIGVAKSSGIAGADAVVGAVKKGGKWLAKNPALGMGGYAWKRSGVPGGIKKGYENATKSGKLFGSEKLGWILKNGQEGRENKISGFMDNNMAGVAKAVEKKKAEEFRKKAKEKAEEHDGLGAVGTAANPGLVHQILNANLAHADSKKRGENAMQVASMLSHLKTDDTKKNEFDADMRRQIVDPANAIHSVALANLGTPEEKDAYVKTEMAKNWKLLNDKLKQAHEVATKGQLNAAAVPITSASATVAIT